MQARCQRMPAAAQRESHSGDIKSGFCPQADFNAAVRRFLEYHRNQRPVDIDQMADQAAVGPASEGQLASTSACLMSAEIKPLSRRAVGRTRFQSSISS